MNASSLSVPLELPRKVKVLRPGVAALVTVRFACDVPGGMTGVTV